MGVTFLMNVYIFSHLRGDVRVRIDAVNVSEAWTLFNWKFHELFNSGVSLPWPSANTWSITEQPCTQEFTPCIK